MSKTEAVINADSRGLIAEYYGTETLSPSNWGVLGRSPRFDSAKALKIIRNDPVVRATIITIVDKALESGWRVSKENTAYSKVDTDKLRKLLFSRVLRKVVFNLILYNNAFLEIVKKGGETTDLNVLESSLMKIVAHDNGDIINYYQDIGANVKNPSWSPEELVHYKIDDFTSNVWSEANLESLYETVLIKDYVRQWLLWFFGTNQIRPIINIKEGAAETKVTEFLSYLKSTEQNLRKPLVFQGEATISLLQKFSDEGASVLELLSWLDNQILILMQVPPIAIGVPDSSGRSNSVEQYASLNTRIFSIHNLIEDFTTNDLFPKMGLEGAEFKFGILDENARTKVFENALLLRQAQFTEEAIQEYLETQGIVFETAKVLKSPEELMQLSNKQLGTGNEGIKGNANSNQMPSRKGNPTGQSNKANNSLMVKNSISYNDYPYTYDSGDE